MEKNLLYYIYLRQSVDNRIIKSVIKLCVLEDGVFLLLICLKVWDFEMLQFCGSVCKTFWNKEDI